MLKTILIHDFALAQNLQVDFDKGLSILTGETGTGKSILVGAISAVLGGRVFSEVIRTGAEKATIEAIFEISTLPELKKLLKEKGLNDSNELLLRREISHKSNSRAFVNDIPVTVKTLSEVGDLLVDFHGQSEHQSILRKETHRYFLDAFGQLDELLAEVSNRYQELNKNLKNLNAMQHRQNSLQEKYDLYQFQSEEIGKTQLKENEDEALEAERNILNNTEKIFSLSAEFLQLVEGTENTNLQEMMGQIVHLLKELSDFSKEFHTMLGELSSAKIVIEESARSIEEFKNKLEYDPKRLNEIEQRLATISLLKKKYGSTIQDILAYQDKIKTELLLKENFDIEIEKLQKKYKESLENYKQSALKLTQARKKVALELEKKVVKLLHRIGMPKIRFQVLVTMQPAEDGIFIQQDKSYYADQFGADQIEFYISTNPGEDYKPLIKIASGGEISRIMLALKNILAEIDQIPLLIFDEIDAGVSGQVAAAVGKSIKQLAETHQIICITHLPQIASYGDSHYRVEKYVQNNRTFTKVNLLTGDERVVEVANLIGGMKISEEIIQSARQLLKEAQAESQTN
jgi:DNA repair protein RecN (Recombination protein N)